MIPGFLAYFFERLFGSWLLHACCYLWTPSSRRIHYDAHACRYLEIPWLWLPHLPQLKLRIGTVGRVRGQHGEALKSSMATYSSRIDDLMQELSAQTAVSVPVCTTCRMLHGVSCVCHHDPNNDRLEMHYIYRYIHIQRCTESCAVSQRQRL